MQRGPTFGNARYVRNLLEAAIGRHAWRLRDVEEPTLEQLRTLDADDLDAPPEPATAGPGPGGIVPPTGGGDRARGPGKRPLARRLATGDTAEIEEETP